MCDTYPSIFLNNNNNNLIILLQVLNQYEAITEILEVHYNHGYSVEDVKNTDSGLPVTHHYYVPGGNSEYNHLYETPGSPGSKNSKNVKESSFNDKQRQENGQYSHLSRGESFDKELKRQPLPVPDARFIVPPRCQWEISRDRLRIERTIGRGEFGLVKKGYALDVTSNGGWTVVAVKTLKGKISFSKAYVSCVLRTFVSNVKAK